MKAECFALALTLVLGASAAFAVDATVINSDYPYGKQKSAKEWGTNPIWHVQGDSDTMMVSESKGESPVQVKRSGDMMTASIAYPTGRRDTSVLWLEKMYPSVVRLGQPYKYTITRLLIACHRS